MSDVKPTSLLTVLATKINNDFAAITRDPFDANKGVVERAIKFGKTLKDAKEKVGHGKWEKWLRDNCSKISKRTAQRYMNLDCQAVTNALGKNDTRVVFSLRQALALANPPETKRAPNESDKYDNAENNLIAKLEELAKSPLAATVEEAAQATIQRLNEAVVRLKALFEAIEMMEAEMRTLICRAERVR